MRYVCVWYFLCDFFLSLFLFISTREESERAHSHLCVQCIIFARTTFPDYFVWHTFRICCNACVSKRLNESVPNSFLLLYLSVVHVARENSTSSPRFLHPLLSCHHRARFFSSFLISAFFSSSFFWCVYAAFSPYFCLCIFMCFACCSHFFYHVHRQLYAEYLFLFVPKNKMPCDVK